ncbi:hypothetical protein [Ornithinimicrobium kibberense]|uniref:hypothetical protein n=1 Tax=Ornithinimicrobium kibberense TaxID=282060 RepID=UPI003605C9CC
MPLGAPGGVVLEPDCDRGRPVGLDPDRRGTVVDVAQHGTEAQRASHVSQCARPGQRPGTDRDTSRPSRSANDSARAVASLRSRMRWATPA